MGLFFLYVLVDCNSPSSSLAYIVRFSMLYMAVSLTVLNVLRGFHTLVRNVLFSSPTHARSYNPPPWEAASSLTHLPVSNSDTRYCPLWLVTYRRRPHDFKTCLLGRSFHTLIRNVLFSSPTDVRSHNPLPLGANILADTPPDVRL